MGRAKLRLEREKLDLERIKAEAAANLANAKARAEAKGKLVDFNDGRAAVEAGIKAGIFKLNPRLPLQIMQQFAHLYDRGYSGDKAAELALAWGTQQTTRKKADTDQSTSADKQAASKLLGQ